ncbi:hypothetical protein Hanom_Chr03g00192771 [Helianthus anomalus]
MEIESGRELTLDMRVLSSEVAVNWLSLSRICEMFSSVSFG